MLLVDNPYVLTSLMPSGPPRLKSSLASSWGRGVRWWTRRFWSSKRALTAVPDDPDGGVALAEPRDGSEAHLVGLGFDELRQVVAHELPFVDRPVHGDLLLPPTLQPHLDRGRGAKGRESRPALTQIHYD